MTKNKIITIDFLSVIAHNINMKEIKYFIDWKVRENEK